MIGKTGFDLRPRKEFNSLAFLTGIWKKQLAGGGNAEE